MVKRFTEQDVPDQAGRTFLVTGANTGLGYETARVLAERGARVLLGCRSAEKAQAAIDQILADNPDADLAFVPLDQADLKSIERAADQVNAEPRLDVLVNNAGIMFPPLEYTQDGFESQFGVNHLGTFALTALLLDKLWEQEGARIISTSSIAHTFNARIYFNDIDARKSYNTARRYSQSKLANMLFMLELDRRLESAGSAAISLACHPGIADTELSRHMPALVSRLMGPINRRIFNTAAKGAWPTLAAATSPLAERSGYYGPDGLGEYRGKAASARIHRNALNEDVAARLWDLSIEMTGIDPGI
ncbi:MAG: oxidoreductase [Pseudomonadota bacterium]